MSTVKRSRYQVTTAYLVSCKDCGEFVRDRNDEPATREEASQAIRDHEEEYHPGDGP